MVFVEIGGQRYPATVRGRLVDSEWNGRSSKAITLEMTYQDALALFVNDAEWYIVYESENAVQETEVYNNSDYCVAGSITDNRDGTVTVKMGMLTEVEALREQFANGVTEEELNAAYMEGVNSL